MRAYTGKELRLDIASESGRTIKLKRYNEDGSDAGDSLVQYKAELRSVEQDDIVGYVGVSYASDGGIVLEFPEMGLGRYVLVIDMSREDGEEERWMTGYVSYIEPSKANKVVEEEVQPSRTIAVIEGEEVRQFTWLPTSAAELAAERAEESASKAEAAAEGIDIALEDAVEKATISAEVAANTASNAAERAESAAGDILAKLESAQAFMDSFHDALYNSIRVIDNYLYVGSKNTGHYLKGEAGITPHIGTDGYWYEGEKKLGDRPAFGADGITPHITPDGFWAFGDFKSNTRAEGRDGIDGSAVRRILVDSYDDIPQSGDTCNGGFLYLVKNIAWTLIGDENPTSNGEWEAWEMPSHMLPSVFTQVRVPGAMNQNDTPVYLLLRTTDGQILGVSQNAVTWAIGDVLTWHFDEAVQVPNGKTVQMFLRKTAEPSTEVIPYEGILLKSLVGTGSCRLRYQGSWYADRAPHLRVYGDGGAEFFDYYAWVESASGAGWVRVERNNDIATSRVYGVMKYATDMTITNGAPVGKNEHGQASVPVADPAVPGVVMPSSSAADTAGGLTHVGSDNKLYADIATPNQAGVGKTSYTRVVENTATVGLTEDNKFAIPPAAAFQWGVNRIGTSIPQSMGMPWIIPVGAAAEGVQNEYGQNIRGQLMNNLLVGGALRTATKETWGNWEPNGIDVSVLPDGSNAVGIMTSLSFSQSTLNGLELNYATAEIIGGVVLDVESVSGSDTLVPTSNAVRVYLKNNYYDKTELYNKTELTRKNGIIEQVLKNIKPLYTSEELEPYATKDWSYENLARKYVEDRVNENRSSIQALRNRVDFAEGELTNCVKTGNSGIREIAKWTTEEWSKLTVIDEDKLHIVLE